MSEHDMQPHDLTPTEWKFILRWRQAHGRLIVLDSDSNTWSVCGAIENILNYNPARVTSSDGIQTIILDNGSILEIAI